MEGVNMMEDGDSDSIEDDMQSFLIDSSDESDSEQTNTKKDDDYNIFLNLIKLILKWVLKALISKCQEIIKVPWGYYIQPTIG